MASVIIDEVKISDTKPIIVSFQNGTLQEGEEKKFSSSVFRNKKNQTMVAVAGKRILYTGKPDNEDKLYKSCLLISNKRTGKVRLIDVNYATLAATFSKPKDVESSASLNTTVNTTMNDLNKQFGSKKIKRRTEQQERMKMNVEAVKEQLEDTVANIEMDETELFSAQADDNLSLYRPPINRDASIKEEVYEQDSLVPNSVLDSLEAEANEVLISEDDFQLCPFILSQMNELRNHVNDTAKEKCKVLLYVNYLINYLSKPAKVLTRRYKACESSPEVNNHILDNFSTPSNTGRSRPITMRDKAICYILVLLIITLKYELNVEELVKDLKMGLKKIQELCRILAFSPSGVRNRNVMVLKLPLPPPVALRNRKRKK